MRNLKQFSTVAEYNAAKDNLVLPNVSLINETNGVEYNPWVDPYNGHEYVDVGLPSGTKWATMNVGANSITEYGNYYQYGKGSAQYAATSGDSNYSGNEIPLALSADTAAQVWGGSWHTPTNAQIDELIANCRYTWVTINGTNGGKFTSKTDSTKYVFFPASGYYLPDTGYRDEGEVGRYLSSTIYDSMPNLVYDMWIYEGYYKNINGRSGGYSIRPVVG